MCDITRRALLTALISCLPGASLHAQASGGAAGQGAQSQALHACSLLTAADVEEVTGQREWGEPDATSLRGGAGSSCTFTNGQIVLFSGPDSEQLWNDLVANYGHADAPKHPVSGIGDRAYFFFPTPRDENEDTNAFIVVTAGPHTLGISAVADDGEPAESARPHALALAKIALAKLR